MSKLPKISGEEMVKILVKKFGFEVSRQRGSHVTLVKYESGRKIVTVVPLHKELKPGTVLGILKLAEISRDEFLNAIS
ncbi:MAG: type II toxin-antitoxin system HicA family toxin [Archaeoglobus sp.]|uniref:type II toxin-antitoxin system HicA family toxin n=1 Tax=Archaeoglobus sp. TaxID=1872626 RepID=UPI001DDE8D81|nr:type II toxin-antitoxin system HicA family toxin [Archaeoglobus sp.]MBO8180831.1 type II toxin-antitoxin system HicA family toxin [Archaeoglobus sp.]